MNSIFQNTNPLWLKFLPKFLRKRLQGRYNLFAILHNSGWLVFDKMMRGLLGLLVGAWVARYLGPSQYGQLAYVLAYIAFFQSVTTLGLDGIVVRDISKFQYLQQDNNINGNVANISFNTLGELLGTIFSMRFFAGLFCWLSAVVIMAITEGLNSQGVYLTALAGGSLVFQAADTIDLWFQSQIQSRRTVLAKMLAYLISNSFRVIFILCKLPLLYFALALFIEFALAAIALGYSYSKFTCGSQWRSKINMVGKLLLKESWPFIISGLSIVVYMRIDQIMVHVMLDDAQVGFFSTAVTIGSVTYFIPAILNNSLIPKLTSLKLKDENEFNLKLVKIFRLYLSISVLVCILVSLFSNKIIYLLYGNKFIYSSSALSLFIFTNIPVFLGVGQSGWILNKNKQKLFLLQTLVGCVTSIIVNFFLIPVYGIVGAALSAVLAQFCSAILINFLYERQLFYLQIGNPFNILKLRR